MSGEGWEVAKTIEAAWSFGPKVGSLGAAGEESSRVRVIRDFPVVGEAA